MMSQHDPSRLPEPPPAAHERAHEGQLARAPRGGSARDVFADTMRIAAEIARPALRIVAMAAVVLLVALLYRVGASPHPDAARLWGLALAGLAAIALLEFPPRVHLGSRRADRRDGGPSARAVAAWGDRMLIRRARRWASIVTLLGMASVALLLVTVAAAPHASLLNCAIAVGGVLLARGLLLLAPAPVRVVSGAPPCPREPAPPRRPGDNLASPRAAPRSAACATFPP